MKGSMYTEEEKLLGDEVCRLVNEDKELKHFFAKISYATLKDFAGEITEAFKVQDKKQGAEVMQKYTDLVKALAMHIYIKVVPKREAEQREKSKK